LQNIRRDIQSRFFGEPYVNYTPSDLVFGFTNDVADKLNGGDYYNGDDFSLSSVTTPIFNSELGGQSTTVFGMYTGANTLDNLGQIRIVNE